MKKIISCLALGLALTMGFTACSSEDASPVSDDSVYVLLNIPFGKFFAQEASEGFDAYSSATQKAANGNMSYGTYHTETVTSEAKTRGITFPVKISRSVLNTLGGLQVTDNDPSLDITVTGRGASTTRYSGKQLLFQNPDYSWYELNEKPSYYKEAEGNSSNISFSKTHGTETKLPALYVEIKPGEAHHCFSPAITFYKAAEVNSASEGSVTVEKFTFNNGDIAKTVTTDEEQNEVLTDKALNALKTIVATSSDGKTYGLTTLENMFWGKSQIGFQAPKVEDGEGNVTYYPVHELVGKTVTKLTFYTETGIYTAETIIAGTTATDSNKVVTFTPSEDSSFTIPNIQAK